jgi:hypothetical protein
MGRWLMKFLLCTDLLLREGNADMYGRWLLQLGAEKSPVECDTLPPFEAADYDVSVSGQFWTSFFIIIVNLCAESFLVFSRLRSPLM